MHAQNRSKMNNVDGKFLTHIIALLLVVFMIFIGYLILLQKTNTDHLFLK